MPEYIERVKAIESICSDCRVKDNCQGECVEVTGLKAIPKADAQEVKHGKWIPILIKPTTTHFRCSLCERTECLTNDYFGKPTNHVAKILPYCHCGARMDGGEKNDRS